MSEDERVAVLREVRDALNDHYLSEGSWGAHPELFIIDRMITESRARSDHA